MNILVTGSRGVLGNVLVKELRERGHIVWGCDLQHCDDAQYIRADISDEGQLKVAFDKSLPQLVYALAAEFGRINGKEYPRQLWTSNCLGMSNTIRQCLIYGSRLVFASSSEAYGNLADYHNLDESLLVSHVPKFHAEYALTKWAGEKQIEIAREHDGLWAVALRFFNVYGDEPYSPYRSVVCQFIYSLLHRQPIIVYKGSRDFLYITDWARTVANIANSDPGYKLSETAYNIGGLASVYTYDLASLIAQKCGVAPDDPLIHYVEAEPGNVKHKVPEINLAVRDLDHRPVVELEKGIELTVAWMRERYKIPASFAKTFV